MDRVNLVGSTCPPHSMADRNQIDKLVMRGSVGKPGARVSSAIKQRHKRPFATGTFERKDLPGRSWLAAEQIAQTNAMPLESAAIELGAPMPNVDKPPMRAEYSAVIPTR